MRQGVILKDTSLIIIRKAEITPEVQPNPSLSLDIVQSMINSTFERQAKSSDELVRRFIEERDGKKLADSCAVSFAQTNPQTSGTSVDDTTMPSPSVEPMNHFHSRTTIDGFAPFFGMLQETTVSIFSQGYMQTAPSFSLCQTIVWPHTLLGVMVEYTQTLTATTKPRAPP
jgi:hypothetical protein